MKKTVQTSNSTFLRSLQDANRSVWCLEIDIEYFQLSGSMPRRLQRVIKAKRNMAK